MMKKQLLMFALLCAAVQGAWSDTITYIDRTWDENEKKIIETEVTATNAEDTGGQS